MPRAEREKGKRGERAVRNYLLDRIRHPPEIRRGYQYRGGADEPDLTIDALSIAIEVKNCKKPPKLAALFQVQRDLEAAGLLDTWHPIAVCHKTREPWAESAVYMPHSDFMELVQAADLKSHTARDPSEYMLCDGYFHTRWWESRYRGGHFVAGTLHGLGWLLDHLWNNTRPGGHHGEE